MKTRKCRRNRRCAVFLLFNAFFIVVIFISSYHHTNRLKRIKELRINRTLALMQQAALLSANSSGNFPQKKPGESVILFWTPYFGGDPREDPAWILVNKTYPTCFQDCRIVLNKSYAKISDAVVFHSRDMRKADMPLIHPPDQIWVYLQQESPSYTKEDLTEYNNVFNWTMTYRQDSDVYHPYFVTIPQAISTSAPITFADSLEMLPRKTKLVAWIVSNCHTKAKRENYAAQLASHIPIDIYGNCGDYSCDRGGDGCFPQIALQYKFYLAFENSLCREYITEKFSNALNHNLVPIVYGEGNYHSVAPPHSYINANDFASPKALAEYLLLLDKTPKLYLQYFQWKTKYKVIAGNGWCSLCQKVKEQNAKSTTVKTYENLSAWWNHHYHYLSPDSGKQTSVPSCRDPPDSLADSWNLLGIVDVVKYSRRWFYKQVLGY